MVHPIDSEAGSAIIEGYFTHQINTLIDNQKEISQSKNDRISELHPLLASIIEDCISIRILVKNSRPNQSYIISRALIERTVNYCYLLFCEPLEYKKFLSYTKNKAARSLNRSVEINGQVKAKLTFNQGLYNLPPDYEESVEEFTSDKGSEKTRWTTRNLVNRATEIEKNIECYGIFISILAIYSDASEAIHGTLYGALFHLGTYSPTSRPHDQASLDRHRHATASMLYLTAGNLVEIILRALNAVNEEGIDTLLEASQKEFLSAVRNTDLSYA